MVGCDEGEHRGSSWMSGTPAHATQNEGNGAALDHSRELKEVDACSTA
jgi:hypothetical protein